MKAIEKKLAVMSAILTTCTCGIIPADSMYVPSFNVCEAYFGSLNIPENSILLTDNKGNEFLCNLEYDDFMQVKQITYNYGIILELEQGLDVKDLYLEYEFNKAIMAPAIIGSNSYVYNIGTEITAEQVEEFSKYAYNLRKMEGVISADVFCNINSVTGCFDGAALNNAMILLDNSDGTLNIEKLNSDPQLQEYLKSIGADTEIKTEDYEYHSLYKETWNINSYEFEVFAITGIDERENIVKICDMLNSFDIINGSAFIASSWLPSLTIDNTAYASRIIRGDANEDETINVQDAAFIARKLAKRNAAELPETADYNKDGKKNVSDAASLARSLAAGEF